MTKNNTQRLELLDGCEINSQHYGECVGVNGADVIVGGFVIDTLSSDRKVNLLWEEYCEQEGFNSVEGL